MPDLGQLQLLGSRKLDRIALYRFLSVTFVLRKPCNSAPRFASTLTCIGSTLQLGAMSFVRTRPRHLLMQVGSPRYIRSVAMEGIVWEEAQLSYIHQCRVSYISSGTLDVNATWSPKPALPNLGGRPNHTPCGKAYISKSRCSECRPRPLSWW